MRFFNSIPRIRSGMKRCVMLCSCGSKYPRVPIGEKSRQARPQSKERPCQAHEENNPLGNPPFGVLSRAPSHRKDDEREENGNSEDNIHAPNIMKREIGYATVVVAAFWGLPG